MGLKLPHGLLCCLFALALLSACSGDLTDSEYLEQAGASLAAGETNAAVIQLKSALKVNPENFDARYMLGMIYLERGQLSDAEKELSRARQIDNGQSAVLVPLARSLSGLGKHAELLEELVPGENVDADSASELFSYRSQSWLALGDIPKAEVELSEARALAPDGIPARISAVHLAARQGDREESRELIQDILALEPENAQAWSLLASLEYSAGAFDKAEEAYDKAIGYRESNALDHLKRAITRISLDDYEGAQEDIRVAQGKAPDSAVTLYTQGLLYFRQGRYAEAQIPFESALNKSPDYMEAVFYLGASHLAQNNLSQAEFNLQRYVTANPQSKHAVTLLGQTYNKLGNPDRTLKLLEPHLKGPQADPAFLLLAGEAYLLKEDPAAAAMVLSEAADQRPGAGTAHMMAGLALLQAGDEAAGVESLETAGDLGGSYRTNVALSFYYLNTKQYDKALETIAKLEGKYPDDPGVYNIKGRVYQAKNDFALARRNFEEALALKADLVSAILSLATLDLGEGDRAGARQRYESLLEINKNSTAAMIGLADLSLLEGREDEYLGWVRRAIEANPSALMPRIYLVNYHLKAGEGDAAMKNAQEALTGNPEDTGALALLGKVQLSVGEKERALMTFQKLAALRPESAPIQSQLARAYAALGRIDDTRDALRKALEFDPEFLAAINALATLETLEGNRDEALKLARRYQQLAPDSSTGLMLEGDARLAAKQNNDALVAYEKALARDSGDGRIIVKIHAVQLRTGMSDSADKTLLNWLEAHPDTEIVRTYIARSFLKRGLYPEATRQYEQLAKLTPENALVFNNLAVLYQRTDNPKALATAETAYRLNPDSADAADTLGWILVKQGQVPRGLELVKQAAAADTSNAERQYHLAYSLAQAGQAEQAGKLMPQLQKLKLSPELQVQVGLLSEQLASE